MSFNLAVVSRAMVSRALGSAGMAIAVAFLSGCDVRNYGYDGDEVRSVDTVYAFRETSPFATVLKSCVLVSTIADSCSVDQMPFIGDGKTAPSIEDVMDRVLVTHNWMGRRFEDALRNAPDDSLLTLFSSATSIVIGSDVRPSFYVSLTAGIQLDANYLWVTNEEKSTVSSRQDARSDFGKDLQFQFVARIADANGDSLSPFFSLDEPANRSVEDMQIPLYRLLYHELTHATDFMPRHKIADVSSNVSLFEAISEIRADWLSNSLAAQYPRTSTALLDLARVRYAGVDATQVQKNLTATEVGEQMRNDGAIQFYSYFSEHEDLAQLLEGVLMSYHFGATTNVGFVQKPASDNAPCSAYLVSWGQRNRLAEPLVNIRSRLASDLVLVENDAVETFLDEKLGPVESMTANVDWCNNQSPVSASATSSLFRSAADKKHPMDAAKFQEMLDFNSAEHPQGLRP